MWAVYKKELKSYFLSPIGYIVIGILLLVCSVFFYLTTVESGSVDLGALYFYVALYGLIITVPILTMRMFAEERKTGTEQLILTSPVGITGVVFGKFLAAMTVIVIALLVSFMYFGIVCYFGTPSILVLLATMLGFLLISAAAIADRNVCIMYNRKSNNSRSNNNCIYDNNIIYTRFEYWIT